MDLLELSNMNRIIIGDVHNCADELRQIILRNPKCEYICVGDLFDRGTNGVKVWELIHKHSIKCTRGNHEQKMIDYFEGRKDYLPHHYYQFLNRFSEVYKLEDLYEFIRNLPLIIKLDESSLVTHGGIDLENPWNPNLSANVYGRWDPNKKVPRDIDSEECWWNLYSHKTLVYYGHVVADTIRYRNGLLEHTNSVGLDTGAVHGGHLSAICHETKQTTVIKSKNYYAEVKGQKIEPSRTVVEFRNRISAITKTNQTIEAVPQMLEVERLQYLDEK